RLSGVEASKICSFINLKSSPWNKHGQLVGRAAKIAEALGADPEEIFPRRIYALALPRVVVAEINSARLMSIGAARSIAAPETLVANSEQSELKSAIHEAIATLPERLQRIVCGHFGINEDHTEMTNSALAKQESVGRERILQLEAKALQMLRHPSRSGRLHEI